MQNEKLQTDNNTMPGILAIALGGAGKESIKSLQKIHYAAGNPFSIYTMAIDTDPLDFERFDFSIDIAPTRDLVNAMTANPQKYGIACRTIIKHHKGLLDYETLGHGARTTRIVTQAAFELHENRIVKGLRRAVQSVLEQGRCHRVMPVVAASLGGGTGSASVILLLDFLTDNARKRNIILGLDPDLLAPPVLFAIDPYAHALKQSDDNSCRRILSNIYATRVELAEYEKQGKEYQYCFHLGLGNDSGAMFATIPQVCEANGMMAWEWMNSYSFFKSGAVNGLDFHKKDGRYRGDDIPEYYCPKESLPPYAEQFGQDEKSAGADDDDQISDDNRNDTKSK